MLIAQITDTHLKLPGKLAYRRVDTAQMLRACVAELLTLDPQPDLIVHTGDLTDFGLPEEYAHLKAILAPLQAPLLAIPGNHDEREAMREAFAGDGYLPARGFLHYAVERGPLRFVGLDTVVPGQGGGELCAERLDWLDATLGQKPDMPTLVLMHHPPFLTGIAHMDRHGACRTRRLRRRDAPTRAGGSHPVRPRAPPDPRARWRPRRDDLPEPRAPGRARSAARGAERIPSRAAGLHAAPLAGAACFTRSRAW